MSWVKDLKPWILHYVQKRSAEVIVSEIGIDMSRFPSAAHLCSWSGLCPGNNESAGKRKSGKTNKGNKHLKSILIQCAKTAQKIKKAFFMLNISV